MAGLWEEDPTAKMGLRCKIHPRCYFCDTPLQVFTTGLLDFALEREKQDKRSHAIDVDFMCPNCGYLDVFGVAITEAHWGRILQMLAEMTDKKEAVFMKDATYYKGDRNVTDGVTVEKTPAWDRTHDIEAHKPKFPVTCFHCQTEMRLRHTTLLFHDNDDYKYELNQACYKCPRCGWFVRFNIIDDTDYLKEVDAKYRPRKSYHPTLEEWSEDKETERQLEGLGYWGGR